MTKVQIDDFICEKCEQITLTELDIKTGIYTCFKCGNKTGGFTK